MMPADSVSQAAENTGIEATFAVHRVSVVGSLHLAEFPKLCVKCGQPAADSLVVHKIFWRTINGEAPDYPVLEAVRMPVCAACQQIHEGERRPIEAGVKNRLLRRWLLESLPCLFPLGVSLFFVRILVPMVIQALTHSRKPWEVLLIAGIGVFFGGLAATFVWRIHTLGQLLTPDSNDRGRDHYAIVEQGPLGCRFIVAAPPTSITCAVDFTDDSSSLFDGERHVFTFENGAVGAKFAERNANRQWDPASTKAHMARIKRWVAAIILALIVSYLIIHDMLH